MSWHQDGTYWGLSSPDVITAWIALTPSTPQSGCMKVVPGTHRSQVPHQDTFAADNLLSRGQEIAVQVNPADAVEIVLAPGEMSLHHVLIFHGSEPNRADHFAHRLRGALRAHACAAALGREGQRDAGARRGPVRPFRA